MGDTGFTQASREGRGTGYGHKLGRPLELECATLWKLTYISFFYSDMVRGASSDRKVT
jgi:hypothetical protein